MSLAHNNIVMPYMILTFTWTDPHIFIITFDLEMKINTIGFITFTVSIGTKRVIISKVSSFCLKLYDWKY